MKIHHIIALTMFWIKFGHALASTRLNSVGSMLKPQRTTRENVILSDKYSSRYCAYKVLGKFRQCWACVGQLLHNFTLILYEAFLNDKEQFLKISSKYDKFSSSCRDYKVFR